MIRYVIISFLLLLLSCNTKEYTNYEGRKQIETAYPKYKCIYYLEDPNTSGYQFIVLDSAINMYIVRTMRDGIYYKQQIYNNGKN